MCEQQESVPETRDGKKPKPGKPKPGGLSGPDGLSVGSGAPVGCCGTCVGAPPVR